jgi:hypothetical protein
MATTGSSKQAATAAADKPASTSSASSNVVPFNQGAKHGYVGEVHPDKNRDDYTATGYEPEQPSVGDRRSWSPIVPS